MTDTYRILTGLLIAGALSALLQRLAMFNVRKREHSSPVPFWQTGPARLAGDGLAFLIGAELYLFFLFFTGRPFLASLFVVALDVLLVLLNNAKEQTLREPLVLADAILLGQVFRYPHMYFPFFPIKIILLTLLCGCGCAVFLFTVETSVSFSVSTPFLLGGLLGIVLYFAGLFFFSRGRFVSIQQKMLHLWPVGGNAVADASVNGPLSAALMHPLLSAIITGRKPDFLMQWKTRSASSRFAEPIESLLSHLEHLPQEQLPHVVLVQAESFSDIRGKLSPHKREALGPFLQNWDALVTQNRTLPTSDDAFGAYTMRTEFLHLTGILQEQLGSFFFNPYILASQRPLWSLARYFGARGYDTVCMHPYYKDFFRRDRVMPNLGFNRFSSLDDLAHLQKFGPYISDVALGSQVLMQLHAATVPTFVFLVTVEAHGPWLPGRLSKADIATRIPESTQQLFSEKHLQYLCHIHNTDAMFGILQTPPAHNERPVLLYAYSDHQPALSGKGWT